MPDECLRRILSLDHEPSGVGRRPMVQTTRSTLNPDVLNPKETNPMFRSLRNAVLALAAIASIGTAALVTTSSQADARGFHATSFRGHTARHTSFRGHHTAFRGH